MGHSSHISHFNSQKMDRPSEPTHSLESFFVFLSKKVIVKKKLNKLAKKPKKQSN